MGLSVLVVDDEPTFAGTDARRLRTSPQLHAELSSRGLADPLPVVLSATSVPRALEAIDESLQVGAPFTHAVVDMQMSRQAPIEWGSEVVRYLNRRSSNTQVILRSANQDNWMLLNLTTIAAYDVAAWIDKTAPIDGVLRDLVMGRVPIADRRQARNMNDTLVLDRRAACELIASLVPSVWEWLMLCELQHTDDQTQAVRNVNTAMKKYGLEPRDLKALTNWIMSRIAIFATLEERLELVEQIALEQEQSLMTKGNREVRPQNVLQRTIDTLRASFRKSGREQMELALLDIGIENMGAIDSVKLAVEKEQRPRYWTEPDTGPGPSLKA